MKRALIVSGCVIALALAACGKQQAANEVSDISAVASDAAASSNALTIQTNLAAADFVDMAAAGDMYEIQAAKIALKRSKTPDVQALAKMMIQDHAKSTALIKKAIADSGQQIELPSTLPNDKQELIGALDAASDEAFDKTYLAQQANAHRDALVLMTGYASSGGDPHLKAAAGQIAPVVQMHIDKIMSIQNATP